MVRCYDKLSYQEVLSCLISCYVVADNVIALPPVGKSRYFVSKKSSI